MVLQFAGFLDFLFLLYSNLFCGIRWQSAATIWALTYRTVLVIVYDPVTTYTAARHLAVGARGRMHPDVYNYRAFHLYCVTS